MNKHSSLRISVVTISFNQGKFLNACLNSVQNQGFENYEHIVVDAASTDGSVDLLRHYRSPKLCWTSEKDNGPADGLNRGFAKATGDIYCYLNADDFLLPGVFERMELLFREDPESDVIYGDGIEVDSGGKRVRRLFSSAWGLPQFIYGACSVVQQSTFFRGSAYGLTRGFNTANRVNWDAELLMDMALAGCKFRYVPELYGAFRVYNESITGSGKWKAQGGLERHRMAEKALGRPITAGDIWRKRAYRLEKWFKNPRASAVKALTYWHSRPSY